MQSFGSAALSFRKALMLVSCLAGAGSVGVAAAQTGTGHTSRRHTPPARHQAAPVVVRKPARPHDVTSKDAETVSVSSNRLSRSRGGGMMRVETAPYNIQTVTRQFIEMRSPTSTALDLIKNLPSVSISTSDSSGMQGGTIQSRSLTDADMALLLDGAPAAAATYLSENVDSENLDSVSLLPGSSPLDLPATTAAAGIMSEVTHDPAHKAGGTVDFSYGTNNLSREFIRLETGEVGNSGIRSYISFSNSHARSWMGAGINTRRHLDFGIRKDWQNGSFAKLFLSWNSEDFTIDNYPTADQFYRYKHTGQGYGHTAGFDPVNNDNWRNSNDHWNQVFLTAPIHVVLSRRLTFDLSPYYNEGKGWDGSPGGLAAASDAYTNYLGTPLAAGTPLTGYYLQDSAFQFGATAKLGLDIDRHNHLDFGYWYQNQNYLQHFPTSITKADGSDPSPNDLQYQVYSGGSRVFFGNRTGFEVHSLFIEDTAKYLNDHLILNAGFKYVMSNLWYASYPGTTQLGQNLTAPLPHISASYRIDDRQQVYINAEGDYRQPDPSTIANTQISGGSFPKNQYSIKEELGYRYHDNIVVVDLALFNYNITNRLLTTYIGAGQSAVTNAGNQTARGFDIMLSAQPIHGFSPYVSLEYLHATMDTNIAAQDTYGNRSYMATRGNQSPQSPHVMANVGLTYTNGGFFGNATLHYSGPQSVTLAGDERIPGYITNALSLGYHFKPFFYAKSPTIRLNFANLTGSIVRTGSNGVGNNATAIRLLNGNPIMGIGGAQFYVQPRFTMTGTISTSF